MIKVVSPQEMARIEALAYGQGLKEEEFMENAGRGVALWMAAYLQEQTIKKVFLLIGKGNNGGDGFVAGNYLLEMGYEVHALSPPLSTCKELCRKHGERFLAAQGIVHPWSIESLQWLGEGVVLDALFGTGFRGNLTSPYQEVIEQLNRRKNRRIAIDIPSGLNGETGEVFPTAFIADVTLYLALPKSGFFLAKGWDYVGKPVKIDFGLPKEFINEAKSSFHLFNPALAANLLPPIRRSRHKYEAGTTAIFAGSRGMGGAAKLAAKAALKGGAGMVYLFHPEGMESELTTLVDEVITHSYRLFELELVQKPLKKAKSLLVGPGIGKHRTIPLLFECLFQGIHLPVVVDADALSLLAEEAFPLPKEAILTPHLGELRSLLHLQELRQMDETILSLARRYVEEHVVTLIIKGAVTFIVSPHEETIVVAGGDPGMATAGSGDVLSGLLASLLAQGLSRREASLLAVHLHQKAGELAAAKLTSYAMSASDLIDNFAPAFRLLLETS